MKEMRVHREMISSELNDFCLKQSIIYQKYLNREMHSSFINFILTLTVSEIWHLSPILYIRLSYLFCCKMIQYSYFTYMYINFMYLYTYIIYVSSFVLCSCQNLFPVLVYLLHFPITLFHRHFDFVFFKALNISQVTWARSLLSQNYCFVSRYD